MQVQTNNTVTGTNMPEVVITAEPAVLTNDEILDNARTMELTAEEAERLMPQPTLTAPWFAYESYSFEEGDALADDDSSDDDSSDDDSVDVNVSVHFGDTVKGTKNTDDDTVDVKDNSVDFSSHESARAERETSSSKASSESGEKADRKK